VVDGPFEFDPQVLTSALRIATAYDYPGLRTFAIANLEKVSLSAVERIRLAREFGLASWEGPAYAELHERDEAITIEEATVLGLDAFVRVAKAREQELRRKDKDADPIDKRGAEAAEGQQGNIKADENSVPPGFPWGKPAQRVKRGLAQSTLASNTGDINSTDQAPSDEAHNSESVLPFQL
jgi:hypothetical protein